MYNATGTASSSSGAAGNTKAFSHVCFWDIEEPLYFLETLYNPGSLEIDVAASIGRPQPVGGTGPAKQWNHVGEMGPYEVVLEYRMAREGGGTMPGTGIERDYAWFGRFVYPSAPKIAPSRMAILWPTSTLAQVCVVDNIGIKLERWDPEMTIREGQIVLKLSNYSQSLRTSGFHGQYGLMEPVTALGLGDGSDHDDYSVGAAATMSALGNAWARPTL